MKPGYGAGLCLYDIATGVPREIIRKRWQDGTYGKPHERPRGDYVKAWLKYSRGN